MTLREVRCEAAPSQIELAAAPAFVDRPRRRIAGVLVPPLVNGAPAVGHTSVGPAQFQPGSLTWVDPRRVKLLHEHQRNEALGYAVALAWQPDGSLIGEFYLPPSTDPVEEARRVRALEEAENGVRDGLSVTAQFLDGGAVRLANGVLDVRSGPLRETSLVSVPAFDDSRVTSVAATTPNGGTMHCTACGQHHAPGTPCVQAPAPQLVTAGAPAPAAPAQPAAQPAAAPAVTLPAGVSVDELRASLMDELMDKLRSGQIAPVAPAGGSVTPPPAGAPTTTGVPGAGELSLSAFTELVAAHYQGDLADPSELRAALSDITPVNQPQAFRPVYLTELWDGTDYVRKFIDNATTTRDLPRALKFVGHRWVTRPIVDDYAGNKADVPSNVPVLEDVEVTVQRLAGAHDVDRALIDLGSPDWLASYFEAQTEDYRRKSDARAATAAWNGAPAIADGNGVAAGEADTLMGGVIAAVIEMANLGEGVDYVAMAPGLIAELLEITNLDAPAFFSGSFQLGGQGDGNLGGLTFFTSPGIPAQGLITGRKTALRWHEKTPPIKVQAVNVGQGGIDLGVFGYYATYVRNAGQLRKATIAAAA